MSSSTLLVKLKQRMFENFVHPGRTAVEQYITTFWIGTIGVEGFSVHDNPNPTTNDIKAHHRSLFARIKVAHGNTWKFVGHIKNCAETAALDIQRSDDGLDIRRTRAVKY